jgi:hypothetical protein
MKFIHGLIAFCLVMIIATLPLMAADLPAPTPFGLAVATFTGNVVFPLLTAFVVGLVTLLLKRLAAKAKLQLSQEQFSFMDRIVHGAVTYVEEYAADQIKHAKVKLTSNEKLEMALEKILTEAPQVSEERAVELVQSMLARIKGAGATGEQAL